VPETLYPDSDDFYRDLGAPCAKVARRIDDAAKHAPLAQLGVSP
jgi:hypothetical protein